MKIDHLEMRTKLGTFFMQQDQYILTFLIIHYIKKT